MDEDGFSAEDAYTRCGNTIKIIALYKSPTDFPGEYVGRMFDGMEPTEKIIKGVTLESVREKVPKGYIRIPRDKRDVDSLVESWIY